MKGILVFVSIIASMQMHSQYCIDAAGSTNDNYDIKEMSIYHNGTLIHSNFSSCGTTGNPWTSINGKYSDYTTQNILLRRNRTYKLVIRTETCSTGGAGAFNHLWFGIDYLKLDTLDLFHNPTFPNFYQGDSIVYNFTIPPLTTTGITRMRIRMDMNCFTANYQCKGYHNGETEDYSVHFCTPLTYTTESDNPKCYGDASGYNRIYVTGGEQPIQYNWNNGSFQNNSINDKLKGGWNYFTIRDKDNCQYKDSFYLEDPPKLGASYIVDSSCIGDSIGSIQVNASGGVGGYQYRLDTNSYKGNSLFEYLPKGSYTVRVKDNNNCILDSVLHMSERDYPKIQFSYSIDSIKCFNSKDGKLSIQATNAVKPFSYAIKGKPYQSDSVISGLDTGLHLFRIKDAKGCFKEFSLQYVNPNPVKINLENKSGLRCREDSDGFILVNAQGGRNYLSNYLYTWSNGSVGRNIAGLKKGSYSVTASDQNNCRDSATYSIDYLYDSLHLAHTLTNPVRCLSDSNAIISVQGVGGLAPYHYSFNGTSYITTRIFPNLYYGVFPVVVRDSLGCIAKTTVINTFIDTPMDAAIWLDTFICPYTTQTEMKLQPINGKPPYSYSLNNNPYLPFQSSIFIPTNQNVEFRIRDSIGCIHRDRVRATTPQRPIYSLRSVHNKCIYDSLGMIVMDSVKGKFPPFRFSLDNSLFENKNSYTQLKTGKYVLYSQDSINCQFTDTLSVKTLTAFSVKMNVTPSICKYDSNGRIDLLYPNLGFKPQISIDGSGFMQTLQLKNLLPKTYALRFLYDTTCILDSFAIVRSQDSLINSYSLDSIRCFGENNAVVNIQSKHGKPPYTYYVNNILYDTKSNIKNLEADKNYWIKTLDALNCKDSALFKFSNPPKLEILNVKKKDITCFGLNDGQFSYEVKGGRGFYRNFVNEKLVNSFQFPNMRSDRYHIKIMDASNCLANYEIMINEPEQLRLKLESLKENKCFGEANGSIRLVSEGGTRPHRLRWNTNEVNYEINSIKPSSFYKAILTDSNGCRDSFSYTFKTYNPLSLDIKTRDASCPYLSDGFIEGSIEGGTPWAGNQYEISLLDLKSKSNMFSRQVPPGSFLISIIDSYKCQKDTVFKIQAPLEPIVELDSIHAIADLGSGIELSPRVFMVDITSPYWTPSIGLSCTDCMAPIASPFQTMNYHFEFKYNNDKCISSKSTQVRINPISYDIYIPNVFSPNASYDENKTFRVFGNKIKQLHLLVFNRIGEKVFESNDINNGWNGLYKDLEQPSGVFIYSVEIEFLDGKKIVRKGDVTLLR
ncbi:MAG: gliding motility-associated C-terminal domain-containing protein [Chitinophagales bacterium]|nr:gliding motility-associated C-terminal domain-containing protein [Sphingobacteriales bacterium]